MCKPNSLAAWLLAMPASVLGNEVALKIGRHRAIMSIMIVSAIVALIIGIMADKSAWVLLLLMAIFAITVPADSGALTSGMTMASNPKNRGATLALHSTAGFAFAALGSWGVGVALDAAGGPQSASAWTAAFCLMAAAVLVGPVSLYWSRSAAAARG